jgi:hypothetical protein
MATNSERSSALLQAEQELVEYVLRKADQQRERVLALAGTSSSASSDKPQNGSTTSPGDGIGAASTMPSEPMSLVDDLMLSLPQLTRKQVEEFLKHT